MADIAPAVAVAAPDEADDVADTVSAEAEMTTQRLAEGVLPVDPLAANILALKKEAKRLREERQASSKALKSASRKASRLRKRARQLTDDDLLGVLMMRKHARATAASSSSSSSSGAAAADKNDFD